MSTPSVTVLLVSGYAALLLVIAWAFDHMGRRSAKRSAAWRTGNFVYHEDQDAWRCHEDQWLWPASFDPDKRVIRYQGQHAICGRCPSKDECSPTPGPRELTRQLDPWPHSEAGRFHRGIALVPVALAVLVVLVAGVRHHAATELLLLVATLCLAILEARFLADAFLQSPAGFPAGDAVEPS